MKNLKSSTLVILAITLLFTSSCKKEESLVPVTMDTTIKNESSNVYKVDTQDSLVTLKGKPIQPQLHHNQR